MNPFKFLTSINTSKEDLMIDDATEKAYAPFIVNRSLSYFQDTARAANLMNRYHHLDGALQYYFLLHVIRKRKRFSKWIKPDVSADVGAVKEYYGYSEEKARSIIPLLSKDQLTTIKQKISKGGRSK